MKNLLIASIFIFPLYGCVSAPPLPRSKDVQTMTVTWVRTSPANPTNGVCQDDAVGCSVQFVNSCVIYAPEPDTLVSDRTYVLGHEMLHCFLGKIHK